MEVILKYIYKDLGNRRKGEIVQFILKGNAANVKVIGYVGSTQVGFSLPPVVSISPGGSRLLSFMIDTDGLAGEYNLSFIIDPDDQVLESNEKNNSAWMMIDISDRPRAELRVRALDSQTG